MKNLRDLTTFVEALVNAEKDDKGGNAALAPVTINGHGHVIVIHTNGPVTILRPADDGDLVGEVIPVKRERA